MQALLKVLYPARCLLCDVRVESEFALCGACWGQTPFIRGLSCRDCGVPLPGQSDREELCDDCLAMPRSWHGGRALMVYDGAGRDFVLRLKHGDRTDLGRAGGQMLARVVRDLAPEGTVIAPVPLHWRRLAKRRYNQSALVGQALARDLGRDFCADLLVRTRRTPSLGKRDAAERATVMARAIAPNPRRTEVAKGRPVLIVDDVMASGATLDASARATWSAGASAVSIAVLARAVKNV